MLLRSCESRTKKLEAGKGEYRKFYRSASGDLTKIGEEGRVSNLSESCRGGKGRGRKGLYGSKGRGAKILQNMKKRKKKNKQRTTK